jgi:hypothetical protein
MTNPAAHFDRLFKLFSDLSPVTTEYPQEHRDSLFNPARNTPRLKLCLALDVGVSEYLVLAVWSSQKRFYWSVTSTYRHFSELSHSALRANEQPLSSFFGLNPVNFQDSHQLKQFFYKLVDHAFLVDRSDRLVMVKRDPVFINTETRFFLKSLKRLIKAEFCQVRVTPL